MVVLKVIEVLSNSYKSWELTTKKALNEAAKTVKNIRSIYVQDQSTIVNDNEGTESRVNPKLTFEVK